VVGGWWLVGGGWWLWLVERFRSGASWYTGAALMRGLWFVGCLVFAASVMGEPAAAQKRDVPSTKKPSAAKPAETKPAAKSSVAPQAKPAQRQKKTPVPPAAYDWRIASPPVPSPAPYVIRSVYQGDVPADLGMRSWQPPPRGQR
jgi:hypothetical protein